MNYDKAFIIIDSNRHVKSFETREKQYLDTVEYSL
jgi:hypothetical protein